MANERKEIFLFKPFEVEKVPFRTCGRSSPRPRSGHRIVCTPSLLVSFGGYNPKPAEDESEEDSPAWSTDTPVFRELWKFCFASRRWRLCPVIDSIPDELASNAVLLFNDILLIFGGTGFPFGQSCSNKLYCYNIEEGNRTDVPDAGLRLLETSGDLPPPQYGQAIARLGNSLYTIGGTNGYNYNCDVHRLDLTTLKWENVWMCTGDRSEGPIKGRYRHELAILDKRLIVLAGGTADCVLDVKMIEVFDTDTHTWSFSKSQFCPPFNYPSPRICHSAVQIQSGSEAQVFIVGGSNPLLKLDDVWRLELNSLQWTKMQLSNFPKSLFFHSSAVTPEGCMYTFGGIEVKDSHNVRTNDLFKLWLCIPKLSEICWEALLHYSPHICDLDKSRLLNCGIPRRFVDRIVF